MKNKNQVVIRFGIISMLILGGLTTGFTQNQWNFQDDGCGATRWYGSPSGAFNLEIKEQTISTPPKKLSIDGGQNGGVRVVGWERNEILVRACVQAFGFDSDEARARTAAVRIENKDGLIRAVSSANEEYSFGANYDIRVPMNSDLAVKTVNGGINLSNISGTIAFDLTNGGVILNKIAGSVQGKTVNGGLTIKLSGSKWEGGGLDARTVNGNISIIVPENYSARFETKSQRGNFYTNLPVNQIQADKYALNLNLGTNGTLIKASTANGQVSIKSQKASGAKINE